VKKQTEPKALFASVLASYCAQKGYPAPLPEHRFHGWRKWAFDFAWPEQFVALEIEGGTFLPGGGRHNRGAGYASDCEKYTEAALLGWKVIRVTWKQVEAGAVYSYLDRALVSTDRKACHETHATHFGGRTDALSAGEGG
jgi:hypothetical protein